MGKLLRISVILILLLGGLALTLAILNHNKRELVVGRTQKMEDTLLRIAATIEREESEPGDPPDFPSRDTSPVSAQILETPDRSRFWNSYNRHLEESGLPTYNLRSAEKQSQLQRYFAEDEEGNRLRDPRGGFLARGEGTMHELLDSIQERATRQYNSLNRTRSQLANLREEHVRTIEELNREKSTRRENLVHIREQDDELAARQQEIRELSGRITRLEGDKRELQLEIAERDEEINRRQEIIQNKEAEIARLKEAMERDAARRPGIAEAVRIDPGVAQAFTHGEKGKIISVDQNWGFVITELTPEFMTELLGPEHDQPLPGVELMVRRTDFKGPAGEFVTKVRLRQMVPGHNIVVADVLADWEQAPPRKGDTLFF